MYVYDEQKIEKEKRKRRLFILMNSLMYVIILIIIGFLKINKNIFTIWNIYNLDKQNDKPSSGNTRIGTDVFTFFLLNGIFNIVSNLCNFTDNC